MLSKSECLLGSNVGSGFLGGHNIHCLAVSLLLSDLSYFPTMMRASGSASSGDQPSVGPRKYVPQGPSNLAETCDFRRYARKFKHAECIGVSPERAEVY